MTTTVALFGGTRRNRTQEYQLPDGPRRELATGDLAGALLQAPPHGRFVGTRVGIKD